MALPPVKNSKTVEEVAQKKAGTHSVWKDGIYLRFMFFVFLSALCFLQMFSLLPVFYKEEMNFSKPTIGLILGLNGLIIALSEMVLVYKLEGKRSPVRYISLGAFFIGLSYALLNLPLVNISLALIAMCTITVGEMLMFPFINSFWVGRSNQYNRGQYASVYSMSFALAHVLAPTYGSQIVRYTSYQSLWFSVFIICIIASFGFNTFKKHHQ